MALFTLSDITYKAQEARKIGPLPNELFGQNLLRYPIDIGSVDKGHYMIIHINVQDKTEYTANYANDPRSSIQKNRENVFRQTPLSMSFESGDSFCFFVFFPRLDLGYSPRS